MPPIQRAAPGSRSSPATMFAVLVLFFGSGCAALLYEMVWFQKLELTLGASAISVGMLLATFMAGLCLGSLALPRIIPVGWHPLRVYAGLELGIGLLGLLTAPGIGYVSDWYAASNLHGSSELMVRAAVCAACLLPATMFMGATLPAVARWVETTPRGVGWLGLFYAGNTLGAVAGCLAAGFYLLPLYNISVANHVAVAVNLLAAAIAAGLSLRTSFSAPAARGPGRVINQASTAWPVYAAIGLSGFCALGAEVIWTRLTALLLGSTTYTLSIILAVFLAGIGLGSSLAAAVVRRISAPRAALGWCQLAVVLAIAWCAWALVHGFPYLPLEKTFSHGISEQVWRDLLRCVGAFFPAACLWGASFSVALAAADVDAGDRGRVVGQLYAANTLGAILGALLFALWLIPELGTQQAQRLLIAGSTTAAVLVLFRVDRSFRGASGARSVVLLGGALLMAGLAAWSVTPLPFNRVAYGRLADMVDQPVKELYRGEGVNATVAVSEIENGIRSFHVSGKVEASTAIDDMRLQFMLSNLPAMIHPAPESALVVGFGSGVTAGTLLPYLGLRRIVICEIEPLIPQQVSRFFTAQNLSVATDPNVEIVYDDARHFVTTTREKFDIITSDPIHPWVKGAATLYTQEYFERVRNRLKPGGIAVQWLPLYDTTAETVRSAMATFFTVFPHASVWSNAKRSNSYDIVLLGACEPLRVDLDGVAQRMQSANARFVAQSLQQFGFDGPFDLLATYAAEADDLLPWLAQAEINRDDHLRLQYLAGLAPQGADYRQVHGAILARHRFPTPTFVGSAENLEDLRLRLARANQGK